MNGKIWVMLALAGFLGLLLIGFSTGLVESSVTLSFSGAVQQTSTGTYFYIVSVSGSNYQVTRGTTGQTVYQSTDATQVINDAVASLTQGGNILFKAGSYNLKGSIMGINKNNITLTFEEGATLFVSNGMNAPAISFTSCSDCKIFGAKSSVTINGNKANQNIDAGTGIHGIMFWSTQNCVVDGVYIDDVLMFGYVSADSDNSGIINSKLTNCGWNGIELGSASGNEVSTYAINNEVAYCGDVGISIFGVSCLVQNNNVHDMNGTSGYGNDHWGIAVEQGSGNTIIGNTVANTEYGIVVGYGTNIVSSNTVTGSERNGIHIGANDDGTTVTGNTVTDWNKNFEGTFGIYIHGNSNTASSNTLLNTAYPHDAGAVYVMGNNNQVFSNTLNVGINLNNIINVAGGTGNALKNNILIGNPGSSGSAFIIGSATDTTIAYNDVTNVDAITMLTDNGVNTMVYDNIPKAKLPDKNW